MKKQIITLIFSTALFSAAGVRTVQGHPWPGVDTPMRVVAHADDSSNPNPPENDDTTFDASTVMNWTGEGEQTAYLIIQWNDNREENAMVFGYRYDGTKYGIDLVNAVVKANPQLYFLTHSTDLGYTVAGFGWDVDADRNTALVKNSKVYTPDHANSTVTTTSYDYDDWTAVDDDDLWKSGWYNRFWTYWCKDSFSSEFSYSQLGASSRMLTDGCVDAYSYSIIEGNKSTYEPWKPFIPVPAVDSGDTFTDNGITYRMLNSSDPAVEVIGASVTDVDAPATVNGYAVRGIADDAFKNSGIVSFAAAGLDYIGDNTFAGNTTLSSVNIGGKLAYVGDNAFKGCAALASVSFPQDWAPTDISGVSIFDGCAALNKVPFPENATSIAYRYFAASGLEEFKLSDDVATLGDETFNGCANLKNFTVTRMTPLVIPENTFTGINSEVAVLHVPYQSSENYFAAAGWNVFTNIEEVKPSADFPVGTKFKVGDYTYCVTSQSPAEVELSYPGDTPTGYTTSLKSAYTSYDLTTADDSKILLQIPSTVIPDGYSNEYRVTGIGDFAFVNWSIQKDYQTYTLYITDENGEINKNIKHVGKYAFAGTVTPTGSGIGYDSSFNAVAFDEALESFGTGAFYGAGVKSILCVKNLDGTPGTSKITEIPESFAYRNSNYCLTKCEFMTDKVIRLNDKCFPPKYDWSNHPAEAFVNLEWVGDECFYYSGAPNTYYVKIGDNLKHLGKYGFGLARIIVPEDGILVVKKEWELTTHTFYSAKGFSKVVFEEGRTEVPSYCFRDITEATEVVLPSTITRINDYAFQNMPAVINIPENVTYIGKYAFAKTNVKHANIPGSVVSIGDYAFNTCTSLETFITNPGTKSFGSRMLYGTKYYTATLKDLVIAPTITYIASDAFYNANFTKTRIWDAVTNPAGTSNLVKNQYMDCLCHYVLMGLGDQFTSYDVTEVPVAISYPDSHEVSVGDNWAVIRFAPSFELDVTGLDVELEEVPEVFREADIARFADNMELSLKYRKQGEEEWLSAEIAPAEAEELVYYAETSDNSSYRKYQVNISDLEGNATYEYQLSHTALDGQTYEDIIRTFETKQTSGVDAVTTQHDTIYPNPATDNFTVNADGEIEVYSLNGTIAVTAKAETTGRTTVNIGSLSSGIYFVGYSKDGIRHIEKLIVK